MRFGIILIFLRFVYPHTYERLDDPDHKPQISAMRHHTNLRLGNLAYKHTPTSGGEWTYKERHDYTCDFIGCCGNDVANPCSPENWIYMNDDTFSRCQNKQQSPIDIETHKTYNEMTDTFLFGNMNCNGTIILKNNTWQIDFQNDKCNISIFNHTWYLENFHIHNAEHTINGEYLPLEIHYVHKNSMDDDLLVISLLVSGSNKDIYEPVLQTFENDNSSMVNDVSPYSLIDENASFYHYQGSLTVPPCQMTENSIVNWIILKRYLEVSHEQIQFFTEYLEHISKSYYGRVNRPIQDILMDTIIYEYIGT